MHKILIADDSPEIINSVTDILEQQNYQLYAALNGINAYMVAQKVLPDLILLDWDMPQLSGIETLNLLKSNDATKDILVIMIANDLNSIHDLKAAFDGGAVDMIKKPFDSTELLSRVRSMLMLADFFKNTIVQKDLELTSQAKNILKNNEDNIQLMKKLEIIRENIEVDISKSKFLLEKVIGYLNYNIKTSSWEQFEAYFKAAHPNFINNIATRYPILTAGELKLCILLRLNMNSKEISEITYQSAHSVDIARYRLRKKFGLSRKDNLNTFLTTFK